MFGDQALFAFITQARLGLGDLVSKDEISALWRAVNKDVKIDLKSPKEGSVKLRRFYADNKDLSAGDLNFVLLMAANLGDHELAMDITEKLATSDPKTIFFAWFPVMHEVRQLPRFKSLIKKIGLVDYWNKFGWPDICHQLDGGDFKCD